MSAERFLLDTVYIQALLNRHDQYHSQAQAFLPRVRSAAEVWVTEAVLVEVGNALSAFDRVAASTFIGQCYRTANMRIVTIDTALLHEALTLYGSRSDKRWGLTDCISFVVMQQHNLTDAVTADEHFVQAGFHALLRAE